MVENEPLVGREAVEPGREVVDEAQELPRLCILVVLLVGRVVDADLFGSLKLAVLGRDASAVVNWSCRGNWGCCVRDKLVAFPAMEPGGGMPERELVVAEFISRRPACGMRVRFVARVWDCV